MDAELTAKVLAICEDNNVFIRDGVVGCTKEALLTAIQRILEETSPPAVASDAAKYRQLREMMWVEQSRVFSRIVHSEDGEYD